MYPLFELVGYLCVCAALVGAARGSILVMFTGIVGMYATALLHGWLIA
jgi:hypothetical protein